MTKLLRKLWRDEEGPTMVEYGLMVALIAVASITAVTLLGQDLATLWGRVSTAISAA